MILQSYTCLFVYNFRQDQCALERSSIEKEDLDESQQAVPPDDPAYINTQHDQLQTLEISPNPRSANALEDGDDPEYATVNLSARRTPQPFGNPASHKVLKVAAKSKPSPSVATWSVT